MSNSANNRISFLTSMVIPSFLGVLLLPGAGKLQADPGGELPVNTTLNDIFMPGTQPDPTGILILPFVDSENCQLCHAGFSDKSDPPLNTEGDPFRNWAGSMMAQASRDPVFYAGLTIANQDAEFGGELCLRCHASSAWLGGRSVPTDGSGFTEVVDFEGVSCHFCHRMVNPQYVKGESPIEDIPILDDLEIEGLLPAQLGTGRYVVDPQDTRRGPFDPDGLPFNPHPPIFENQPPIIMSPFHSQSDLCATCHDVSNPIFLLQKDGSYAPNALDAAHPTMDKYDMFPMERTYSEWLQSQFANGGVVISDGRFGGNLPDETPLESCQDCHMPDQQSHACRVPGFDEYDNMPQHAMNGGNTWVLQAVRNLYSDSETGLNDDIVDAAQARVEDMLRSASDMELTVDADLLNVRIINYSGHKLPTGYAEGRRMWINVKYYDQMQQLIEESGAYDFVEAILDTKGTKIYKCDHGIDEAMAALTGLPVGETHHFVLNNTVMFDNRIPPIGFNNAAFEAVQAEPVGYTYADEQYWDDTGYQIPPDAVEAVVTLYFQTTSREYIEFLLNENTTDDRGQIAYDQWVLNGMSAPLDMDMAIIDLGSSNPADLNGDGVVSTADLLILLSSWGPCDDCNDCPADIDDNCSVGTGDLLILFTNWG